ncbi:hypothetical protein [Coleofasciculus sp. G2-EDA-02]|uniref:hypothetical protein n=1 Tax=Coleofasciculus sp. G2-EDA-02 TaxID=3069529 RepID=UPI0032FB7230
MFPQSSTQQGSQGFGIGVRSRKVARRLPFQFFGSLNFSKKERIAPIKSNRQEIVDFFQKLKTRDLQLNNAPTKLGCIT